MSLRISKPNAALLTMSEWFFFFQAEDGIRDVAVTGVQTCALPILPGAARARAQEGARVLRSGAGARSAVRAGLRGPRGCLHGARAVRARAAQCAPTQGTRGRSEGPRSGARPRGGPLRLGSAGLHLRLGLASGRARLTACR